MPTSSEKKFLILTGSQNVKSLEILMHWGHGAEFREAKAAGICRAEYQRHGPILRKNLEIHT